MEKVGTTWKTGALVFLLVKLSDSFPFSVWSRVEDANGCTVLPKVLFWLKKPSGPS
jgi:hypothetical protein